MYLEGVSIIKVSDQSGIQFRVIKIIILKHSYKILRQSFLCGL